MTKEIDLVGYLPPFLAEYSEMKETLKAEEPEFKLLWDGTDKILKNEFIETADEYGISRFEKLLDILPFDGENLEARRSTVRTRWFKALPYTLRQFINKLVTLCGGNDFTVVKNFDFYEIKVITNLEMFGNVNDLKHLFDTMLPCNMTIDSKNDINCFHSNDIFTGGAVLFTDIIFTTNDFNLNIAKSGGFLGSTSVVTDNFFITNDFNLNVAKSGGAFGSASIITEII